VTRLYARDTTALYHDRDVALHAAPSIEKGADTERRVLRSQRRRNQRARDERGP
jgi:hypothetical protein